MRIKKHQLCESCRLIHPIMSGGKAYKDSVGEILDSEGYNAPSGMYIMINQMVVGYLQDNKGCSMCINVLKRATEA